MAPLSERSMEFHLETYLEKSLAKDSQNFELLANSMPQIVWTSDPEGNLDFFNEQWYAYSGFERHLTGNEAWVKIIHPDDHDRVLQEWQDALAVGVRYQAEFRFLNPKKPGTFRWFLVRALPYRNTQGEITKWIGTSTDIHDQKEFMKRKDDFLAITTHELRAPLTALKLQLYSAKSAMQKQDMDKGLNYINKIEEQINRMSSLVDDLSEVIKIQQGQLPTVKETFSLNDTVQEVISMLQPVSPGHQLNYQSEAEVAVCADRKRITQVIINLISNAVKYSPEANAVNVLVSKTDQKEARLVVEDFGLGISKQHLPHIFEQFYRAGKENDTSFEGLGLGLFIAKEIAEKNGGHLEVTSTEGIGSQFTLKLPLAIN